MSIEVLIAAPDKLLTTVAKVKAMLGITTTDQDTVIADMIAAASDFAVRFTGRDFAKQTVKESIVGKGKPDLMVSITPIVTLIEVCFDEAEYEDVTLLDKEAGFIQRRAGFLSTEILASNFDNHPSSYGEKRWHVTYTGGFVLPNWDTSKYGARTLPYDLERAIMEMVKTTIRNNSFDGTMKSYKIGDTAVTWDRSQVDGAIGSLIPPNALAVLNYYRRPF